MRGAETNLTPRKQQAHGKYAHAGSRTRVTSMGGLYDAATLRALLNAKPRGMLKNKKGLLAQGASWAVAVTQAFLQVDFFGVTCSKRVLVTHASLLWNN